MTQLTCDNCSKTFYRESQLQQRLLKRGLKHSFCSRKCYGEWIKGKRNPLWKHGKSDTGTYYAQKVIEENNIPPICQICNDPEKKTFIHHKDEDRTNNQLSNLLVVCWDCHQNLHLAKWSVAKCDYCGNKFCRKPSQLKPDQNHPRRHHFCSLDCYHKWMKGKKYEEIWSK